jgi:hypothetical protein
MKTIQRCTVQHFNVRQVKVHTRIQQLDGRAAMRGDPLAVIPEKVVRQYESEEVLGRIWLYVHQRRRCRYSQG